MTKLPELPTWIVGPAARAGAVTVLPLFTDAGRHGCSYRLGVDALGDSSLEIREGHAHVLEARNRGERVLLVEGDHLLGAHQSRMLTSSALVAARATLGLPVSCVEQGRASGPSSKFLGAGPM